MMDGHVLDPDQERAASAPPDARQIVIAGPGAGKSEVVGERCRRLIEQDVYPEEIFVISFSNVAVDVVRARTKDVVDEGRGVDCATIDSLAGRVRAELEEGEPRFSGFDEAIERATRLLESADEPAFPDVRHVVIDEVQDVVGVRARFALALLDQAFEAGVGFTLLGDPMQSLYDFQVGAHDAMSAETFLEAVRERYGAATVVLSGEYRSRTPEARAVALVRAELEGLSPSDQLLRLRDLSADLPPLGELDEDAVDDIGVWKGTTALLCDTNARAALVAARFAGLGLPVELAASATNPSLSPWIGRLHADNDSGTVSLDEFLEQAETAGLSDIEEKWRILVRVSQSRRGLELRELATALASRRYPPDLLREPSTKVVASTVHRAKGQEFDNVVLVDPQSWFTDLDDARPAARRLFVAMSRARSRLTRGRGVSTKFWRKEVRDSIWRKTSPRGRGTLAVIIEPHHARHLGPVGHDLAPTAGAAVTWSRTDDIVTVDSDELPSWLASVDGLDVARTGEEFGRLVRRLAYGDRVPSLSGGQVEGTETLVGAGVGSGPRQHGLWVGARVSGPLSFEWE
jgi:hypothetical protein